jgi:hypothetical protein
MSNGQSASRPDIDGHEMHDVDYLRARAMHLREAAATSRDPEIARALREVAGDFDSEAQREAARHSAGQADQRNR